MDKGWIDMDAVDDDIRYKIDDDHKNNGDKKKLNDDEIDYNED